MIKRFGASGQNVQWVVAVDRNHEKLNVAMEVLTKKSVTDVIQENVVSIKFNCN